MKKQGNYIYAAASFTAALTIGFLVQKADTENRLFAKGLSFGASTTAVNPDSVQLTSAEPSSDRDLPPMPQVGIESGDPTFSLPWVGNSVGGGALTPTPETDQETFNAYGVPCETSLQAQLKPAALVDLDISASCHPNEPFDLVHAGLRVSGMTSPLGAASITVPAMASDAKFEVIFEGGERIEAIVDVPDFAEFERVALQWQGGSVLQIHALEFGATYGQTGHVWNAFPRNSEFALGAHGGFLTTLAMREDAAAWQAEVYSFPSGSVRKQGMVRLSIEAEITPTNCGQDVLAQTLHPKTDTGVEIVDLTVAMPDCSAVGEVLVLNNLLRDIKVASN